MTITINGNGTIGGVSVGGLPDGIVDTDMLASAAVTSAKVGSLGASNLPAGSVLQVVHGSTKTNVTATTTANTDTGLSASITPSSASSKILVLVSQNVFLYGATTISGNIFLYRNTTYVGTDTTYGIWTVASGTPNELQVIYSINHLDSPATTSSITYKTQQVLRDGPAMRTQRDSGFTSTMTLMEIAG